jgi:hypothetical protein
VTPGLPNDHYHAFLDPIVLALAGVGLAAVAGLGSGTAALPDATGRTAAPSRGAAMAGQVAAVVLAGGLGAAAVLGWPPAVSDDGGWRGVDAAAARLVGSVGTGPGAWLVGIPPFKSADALRFPLERRGLVPANTDPVSGEGGGAGDGEGGGADDRDPGGAGGAGDTGVRSTTIVVCDPLFDEVVGAPCGGPAEAAWAAASAPGSRVVERFDAGSRRVISVYEPASP